MSDLKWRKPCEACEGEGQCDDCGGAGLVWTDELVTLADCRPGPFLFGETLGFKTEYGAAKWRPDTQTFTISTWPDAYCMDSGEFFWGGMVTQQGRAALMVLPVEQVAPVSSPAISGCGVC